MSDEESGHKVFRLVITGYYPKVLRCMACKYEAPDLVTAKRHYLNGALESGNIFDRAKHDFRWESQLKLEGDKN